MRRAVLRIFEGPRAVGQSASTMLELAAARRGPHPGCNVCDNGGALGGGRGIEWGEGVKSVDELKS